MPLTTYTAGDVLTAASLNNNFTFAAANPTGNFVYISQGTFSAVASVSMAAGTFTSTYDHYKVFLDVNSTSTGQNVGVRVNVAGVAQTGSSWFGGFSQTNNSGTVTGIGSNSATSAVVTGIHGTTLARIDLTVFSPADATNRTYISGTGVGMAADGNVAGAAGGALYNVAAAHDGLTFLVGGTFGGTYYVYGLKDS
jgi:hypothetical protein